MKVLVTIGSMVEKKFTRLFQMVDTLCEEGVLNGADVTAQVGFDAYQSKYYKCFDMISDEQFKQMIDDSDLIITHAGTGTVTSCLKKSKRVIIVPRITKYDEHYDDHQLELADLFKKQNYVEVAQDIEELRNLILHINDFQPAPFTSNNAKMNQLVIDFIEKR